MEDRQWWQCTLTLAVLAISAITLVTVVGLIVLLALDADLPGGLTAIAASGIGALATMLTTQAGGRRSGD